MDALGELVPLIEEAMQVGPQHPHFHSQFLFPQPILADLRDGLAWQDEESFVFLAAINTLVGLADVAPSEALPLLAARLSDEAIATPLRLMLTEVLEKAARQCGDVLPHYAPIFVNAFMVNESFDHQL